jgi:hypothetical protein
MPCSGPRVPFSARSRSRARVDQDKGIQARAGLVVGLDAREVRVNEPARRHPPAGQRGLQLGDRQLVHLEQRNFGRRLRPRGGGLLPALGEHVHSRHEQSACAGREKSIGVHAAYSRF